jgi:nicotinamide riboside kinase
VVKVWCEFVFGKCHHWILQQIASRKYELYLLCAADLPWAPDELREYPDLATREKLFHIYKDLLIQQATPWMEIRGTPQERLLTATRAVDGLL